MVTASPPDVTGRGNPRSDVWGIWGYYLTFPKGVGGTLPCDLSHGAFDVTPCERTDACERKYYLPANIFASGNARAWIRFRSPYKVIIRALQLVLLYVLASIGWHHCRTQNVIGPRNWSTVTWPAPIGWWRRVSPAIYTTRAQDLGSLLFWFFVG